MSTPPAVGPRTVADLLAHALSGALGPDPATLTADNAFLTRYDTRHPGRARGYRNAVLCLRTGAAVGSCAIEPGTDADDVLAGCAGARLAELLTHPLLPVRVAALDTYLLHVQPHPRAGGRAGAPVVLGAGDTLTKSRARARAVADLLPGTARHVLVVGVVGSLLAALRERGMTYTPCDFAGGTTEWGEPVHRDPSTAPDVHDALLVTGMTLGNGTFDALARAARARDLPLVAYAQTGSGILPWFLGAGVTAVSAEPYPFFSLDGGPSTLHHYRDEVSA
ncbi:Rossmann-like domain-containing protein [Nocardia thailandica]|uniref:Rossmann-like domain-containing protein n=1 Tax=Nocardia thailandica TaxID=257275 RepID=UPI0002E18791|nr:DUF364 domain-containing protein [Nocardia thailandica]